MTTPTPGPRAGYGLSESIEAALDQVEADLPDATDALDPALHELADETIRSLHGRVRDPLALAVLSREKIFVWCLRQAVQPARPPFGRDRSPLYRKADPLSEQHDSAQPPPADAPPKATRRTTTSSTRGVAKEKKS